MSGFIGGSLGYRLLRRVGRKAAREGVCDGSPYQEHSKLEVLFGPGVWDVLADKTVIDFGCGIGTEVIDMATRGNARRVIGIDIREDLLEMARRAAAEAGVADRCLFATEVGEPADVVVSLDGFEHYDDPAGVLKTMRYLLRDEGVVLTSFGPPWFHPYGGHLFSVFPWAHLIFTEPALIRWRSDFKSDGARRFNEVEGGLNQMTVRKFSELVASSDFDVQQFEAVPIGRLRRLSNAMTRELFTSVVRCRLVARPAQGRERRLPAGRFAAGPAASGPAGKLPAVPPRASHRLSRVFRTCMGIGLLLLSPACTRRAMCDASDSLASTADRLQLVAAKQIRPSAPSRTTLVRAGTNLQKALNSAKPGDLLVLEAGATFTGPFVLPKKSGSGWIVIQSSAMDRLPTAGTRVSPSNSKFMPVLESAGGSVLATQSCASRYWFIGIEIRPAAGAFLHNLVQLGNDEKSVNELPHDFVFERCYLHGDPIYGARRGIAMNSRATIVMDSYLADFKEVGADSQAILSWNGAGPFSIVNNELQAAGENVMFGSGDPSIQGLVPSDIEIRGNHFSKPLSWKVDDRSYGGTPWTVKNLFELKNARRVLIDGNLFEYNWPQAQNGFAILFTVRNQYGGAPWSTIEDVTFTNNIVRHVGSGVNILGRDNNHRSGQTRRVQIRNNLFIDIGGEWGPGRLFQLLDGTADVAIEHNTALHAENFLYADGRTPHTGFIFRNNIVEQRQSGLIATGTAPGLDSLRQYFPGAVMAGNAIVGAPPNLYPPDNSFPKSLVDVGFINVAAENYRLAKSSRLHMAGTDGRDVGVDFEALANAQRASASPQLQLESERTVSGLRAAVIRK